MVRLFLLFALLLMLRVPAAAYSVLTHQANVDSAWKACIEPALRRRDAHLTEAQLREARSYAYGGAIIQDMGYYPFGAQFFTNLTHYVRTGDFVQNLLNQAQDVNEYAFALGALAHYAADNNGHPEGTNRAMALVYPKLGKKYGKTITYEDEPHRHTQLEFSFDVVQVAAGRYRSEAYHDFIGFRVARPVLERAFQQTYGLTLGEVFVNVDLAIGSYRFSVSQLIPEMTRAAWHYKRADIYRLNAKARKRDVVYRYSEKEFRREFKEKYERPGFFARMLSRLFHLVPKIGPLRPFALKVPPPEAQVLFQRSFRDTRARYCELLARQTDEHAPPLPDTDFDTGKPTAPGEYKLTDATYGELLHRLDKRDFRDASPALRADLLRFFDHGPTTLDPHPDRTTEALAHLKQQP